MEVKKILCAVDLEDTIAPSVEYAKMMASMTGASIWVAYVIPAHTPYEDVYLSVNNQPNEVNNPNETIQKSMNALLAEQFAGMDATGVILVGRPSEELVKLAGVGRKTATLFLADAYGIPGVTVDTHVFRISHRLGWANGKNPVETEQELMRVLPKDHWNRINFQLIYHGRSICTARKAKCSECGLQAWCEKRVEKKQA